VSGTSHPFGKDLSADWYADLAPATVIDVGPGCGTYARLFRARHHGHWTALEVHAPYVDRYQLGDLYDEVLIRDMRDGIPAADLAIFGDVIEHVPFDDGAEVIRQAKRNCGAVLVSIPLGRYDQGPIDGNRHETHLATWTHDDVCAVLEPTIGIVGDPIGVYWWTSPS
jgi:hypothetical protein